MVGPWGTGRWTHRAGHRKLPTCNKGYAIRLTSFGVRSALREGKGYAAKVYVQIELVGGSTGGAVG